jgi:NTP pyrophosphatase (non-canonical NTP hydrolase)
MTSNFRDVVYFNKSFGVPVNTTIQKDIFKTDPKLVKLRLDLILEEVKELQEAVTNHDMTETIDALADILYVVYGAGASFGINLDQAFKIVHDSNMSKLCQSEDDAISTVALYEEKYKAGASPYDSPAHRLSDNGKDWVVYNKSTGKILKNYKYTPANFEEME